MVPAVAAAAIMAGASLIGNQLNSAAEQESKEQGRAYLSGAQSRANSDYASIINQINDYYNNRVGAMGTSQDVADYASAIRGYNADDYVYMPGEFNAADYGVGDRKSYLTPYYDQIINDTASKVQQTAAGAGVGRGSGAAAAIAQAVAEKSNELYKEANQEYKDDRNFAYNQYNDYIQNMQNALAQKRAAMDTKVSLQGNLASDYLNAMDAQQSDILKARQDAIATNSSYANAMASLY